MKANNLSTNPLVKTGLALGANLVLCLCQATTARANGLLAELRSAAAILPSLPPGMALPTAPAGAVIAGAQPWVADASQGFSPVLDLETGVTDPLLALSTAGLHLPISPTTVPATCGQIAYDGRGNVYITQGVVDTTVTPSPTRCLCHQGLTEFA